MATVSSLALAQRAPAGGWTVVPSVSVTETVTDNHRNTSSGPDRSESITTVSGGLRINGRRGRVQANVDYGLTGVLYARDSKENSVRNRLSASVLAEPVPSHLSVAAAASISRQPRSAFGRPDIDGIPSELNQSEVRTLSIQPVLRGVLGGVVAAQASVAANKTSSNAERGSDGLTAALSLSSVGRARLGWAVEGSRQSSQYDGGREITTDRAIATLFWRPDVDLQFSLRGGQERTDLTSLEQQRYDNYGAGVLWVPTPRTRISLDADRRSFGHSHALSLEHRMRRSVIRYVDSQSVSTGSGDTGGSGITAYDLFFQLFASQEPDPALRDTLVRTFLARNGITPDTILGGAGFLTSAATLQRRQELSLALSGARTTYVVSAFASRRERADTVSTVQDDLSLGPIRQRGMSFTVTHRLTPRDSLSLTASTQRSLGEGSDTRSGRTDTINLGWSTRLNERSSFGLTARHAESDTTTDAYTENAVTAAFSTRF